MGQVASWAFGGDAILIAEPDGETVQITTVWRDAEGWSAAVALAGPRPETIPAEPPPVTIAMKRAAAKLPRAEFLMACVAAGLMTEQDALSAAKGEVPPAFADVIAGWPAAQRFEAGLRWAALTQVDRLHPMIVAVAQAIGVSEAQLDALFGIPTGDAP